MDNKIIPQIAQIRELKELQVYAQAQYNTILQLTKKVKKIEDEKTHLEGLLKNLPVETINIPGIEQGNDQELICKMEIRKLREFSSVRELTYEESKRLQIYTQILEKIPKVDKRELEVKELETDKLIQLVKSEKE